MTSKHKQTIEMPVEELAEVLLKVKLNKPQCATKSSVSNIDQRLNARFYLLDKKFDRLDYKLDRAFWTVVVCNLLILFKDQLAGFIG